MTKTSRREFLALFATTTALVGCTTSDGRVGVPVNVTLPTEVTQIISDAQSIVDKGKTFLKDPTTTKLISQAEDLIGSLKSSGETTTVKSVVGTLAGVLGTVSGFLPAPYNIAAGVLVSVAKAYAGQPIAARLAMSPETARRVMQN